MPDPDYEYYLPKGIQLKCSIRTSDIMENPIDSSSDPDNPVSSIIIPAECDQIELFDIRSYEIDWDDLPNSINIDTCFHPKIKLNLPPNIKVISLTNLEYRWHPCGSQPDKYESVHYPIKSKSFYDLTKVLPEDLIDYIKNP
jgi:hypothetical protein